MRAVYHLLPLLSLLAVHGAWFNPFREAVDEANALHAAENYDDAAQAYIEVAGVYAPESPKLRVNLGNTLYAAGDFVRAASEYTKVYGTGQPTLDSNGLYGLGNARFQQEDYQGAIDVYERALDLTPDDEDVKYNLEVARIRLKELLDKMKDQAEQQQDQQQGDQQQEQQDQEQQDQEQQGEQEQDEQQQQGQQEQQEQGQEGEEEQDSQSGQEESTPTPTPAESAAQGEESKPEDEDSKQSEEQPEEQDEQMTQAQVQRFLDAMERDEKRRRADKRREQSQGVQVEKDW